jgi:hypothetical protein
MHFYSVKTNTVNYGCEMKNGSFAIQDHFEFTPTSEVSMEFTKKRWQFLNVFVLKSKVT